MTGADLITLIKKQPIAFACGLLVAVCGVLFYFRSEAVAQAQAEAEAKQQEAKKIEANVRFTAGLAEATEEMVAAGRQFESRLVRAGQLANNLQFFYRLEADTGVKLVDVRQQGIPAPRAGERRGAYAPVPFAVSIQGSHDQIHDFLRRVEAGPHFVRFSQITIAKVSGGVEVAAIGGLSVAINLELLGTP
jgi:Tfp pilus assembly protein PilO